MHVINIIHGNCCLSFKFFFLPIFFLNLCVCGTGFDFVKPKVGAPPEVVGRLSALAGELDSRAEDMHLQGQSSDPELDEFMVIIRR